MKTGSWVTSQSATHWVTQSNRADTHGSGGHKSKAKVLAYLAQSFKMIPTDRHLRRLTETLKLLQSRL